MIDLSPENTRKKFFVRSQGGARRWQARDHIVPRQLSDVLGVNSGGPEGRWQTEEAHTVAHYEQFMDLIQRMLTFDPLERLKPSDGLDHPFLAPLARNRSAAAAGAGAAAAAASAESHQSQGLRSNVHAGGQGVSLVRTSSGGGLEAGGGGGVGGLIHTQPSQSHAHPNVTSTNMVTPPSTASTDLHQPDPSMSSTPPQHHSAATQHHPEQHGGHARRGDPTAHISQQHQAELSTALHAVGCPESRLLHYHTLDWEAISEVLRTYTTIDHAALMQVNRLLVAGSYAPRCRPRSIPHGPRLTTHFATLTWF